jgi:hypothetical protein
MPKSLKRKRLWRSLSKTSSRNQKSPANRWKSPLKRKHSSMYNQSLLLRKKLKLLRPLKRLFLHSRLQRKPLTTLVPRILVKSRRCLSLLKLFRRCALCVITCILKQ